MTGKERLVGYIPNEISKVTKIFIDKGSTITVQLGGNHYRRSPLVQGELKITCKLAAAIPGTVSNLFYPTRYEEIVTELYIEPKNEETVGFFLELRKDVLVSVPTFSKRKKVSK